MTRHLASSLERTFAGEKYYKYSEILLSKHSLSQNKYYFNLSDFLKR